MKSITQVHALSILLAFVLSFADILWSGLFKFKWLFMSFVLHFSFFLGQGILLFLKP